MLHHTHINIQSQNQKFKKQNMSQISVDHILARGARGPEVGDIK